VIGVKNNWNAICWSNGTNEEGSGNTSGNGSLLLAIGNTLFPDILASVSLSSLCVQSYLSCEVGGASLGHLENDGSLGIASSFK